MCTLNISLDPEDDYPVVIVANRDEFYSRPSAPPSFEGDNPWVFAPRDLEAGGTWFGINEWGLVAAITNVWESSIGEDPAQGVEPTRSRGLLTLDTLRCKDTDEARQLTSQKIKEDTYQYFNLLVATPNDAWVLTYTGKMIEYALTAGLATILNAPYRPSKLRSNDLPRFPGIDVKNIDWLEEIRRFLSRHPEICHHGDHFGTRSSQVIVLPKSMSDRDEQRVPCRFWYADGPPCKTTFVDLYPQLRTAVQSFSPSLASH